jgi:hypothetical protein
MLTSEIAEPFGVAAQGIIGPVQRTTNLLSHNSVEVWVSVNFSVYIFSGAKKNLLYIK